MLTLLSDPSLSLIEIWSILKFDIDFMMHFMPFFSKSKANYEEFLSHFIPSNLIEKSPWFNFGPQESEEKKN